MAVINIASGKTISKTAQQVKADLFDDYVYTGVDSGAVETLSIQLAANQALLLAGKDANFVNVALKINGSAGNDTYSGTGLDETILGNGGNDKLLGNGGNDTIDGGAGKDVMFGGVGDDTYVVDNAGDKVTEVSGAGTDTVKSSINYTLVANLENLTLTGKAANGTGNALDNVITGNASANVLNGGAGDDTLDGGAGKDTLTGGAGDDTYVIDATDILVEAEHAGTDTVEANFSYTLLDNFENLTLTGTADTDGDGNNADNVITGNAGANVLDGGDGDDTLIGGDGDDVLLGGEGNNILNGGAGADILSGGDGDNTYIFDREDILLVGAGEGSDTYVIDDNTVEDMVIDGGTSALGTDATVDAIYYNSAHTSISTVNSTLGTPNATDIIQFTQSGDFSNIEFMNVEQIHLDSGVAITFSSEQLDTAIGSLDQDVTNPGLHFYGVAGGAEESVTVVVDYADVTFTPAGTVVGATPTTYNMGDFQLDDASIGDLFHNVTHIDDFNTNSTVDSYARADGSNSNDYGIGSKGVDNVTLRLGDDTYYGNEGNDLLIGHQGNDYLDGGAGNDIFNITGFETGVFGISGKADDGHKEWNATGVSHDVIVGGEGVDTLRITAGAVDATAGTVVLNDDNFQSMERVEIGTTVGRINVEDSALQLLNDHYYLKAGTTESATAKVGGVDGGTSVTPNFNHVSVDASGITDADDDGATGGLTFVGNGNINTFIGTENNDTFIGNGGNDVLTGGLGGDTFQFGKVHTMTVTGAATIVQTYTDVASNLTGSDAITDFVSGTDHLSLDNDFFAAFTATGAIAAGNLVQGVGAVALDADDYLIFDASTNALYYDADGSGAGAAVQFAALTGVASLTAADFSII